MEVGLSLWNTDGLVGLTGPSPGFEFFVDAMGVVMTDAETKIIEMKV